jgi:hypothetical protein
VGLEDDILVRRRVLATNVDLVAKTKRLAAELEREIATPDEAREILGLEGLDAVNFWRWPLSRCCLPIVCTKG